MDERTRKYLAYALVVISVLVAGYLGVQYPVPDMPEDIYLRLTALETGNVTSFAATGSGEGYTNLTSLALSDDLYVGDDASVIGDLDAATLGVTGAIDFDSTLNVDGAVTFNSTLDLDGNLTSGTGAVTVADTLNVTGAATFDSTVDIDGNITSGTGAVTVTDIVNVGVDGTGHDVIFYSDTAGDNLLWDESEEALTITGTNAQDALNVDDGNVDIADDVDIDGTTNLDEVDVDGSITGALSVENVMLPTVASTSFTYTAAAGGTIALFTIGDGEIWDVHGVYLNVTTNFDCNGDDCAAVLGDGNDTDGFCVLADAELQAADTEGTGWAAGWQCQVSATRGVYQDGTGGFWYAPSGADETIDVVLSAVGEDFSAGAATAYIIYTRIQ